MKKKFFLAATLVGLFGMNISAQAANNASATYTGTLGTYYSVVKAHDGSGTISESGALTTSTSPDFNVTTNNASGCSGYLTMAQVASTNTMANQGGTTYVALTTTGATSGQIDDALAASPDVLQNENVIAYTISCTPSGGSAFTWNGTDNRLQGVVMSAAGTKLVTVSINGSARIQTFGSNDPGGAYTANMTLTAVASL